MDMAPRLDIVQDFPGDLHCPDLELGLRRGSLTRPAPLGVMARTEPAPAVSQAPILRQNLQALGLGPEAHTRIWGDTISQIDLSPLDRRLRPNLLTFPRSGRVPAATTPASLDEIRHWWSIPSPRSATGNLAASHISVPSASTPPDSLIRTLAPVSRPIQPSSSEESLLSLAMNPELLDLETDSPSGGTICRDYRAVLPSRHVPPLPKSPDSASFCTTHGDFLCQVCLPAMPMSQVGHSSFHSGSPARRSSYDPIQHSDSGSAGGGRSSYDPIQHSVNTSCPSRPMSLMSVSSAVRADKVGPLSSPPPTSLPYPNSRLTISSSRFAVNEDQLPASLASPLTPSVPGPATGFSSFLSRPVTNYSGSLLRRPVTGYPCAGNVMVASCTSPRTAEQGPDPYLGTSSVDQKRPNHPMAASSFMGPVGDQPLSAPPRRLVPTPYFSHHSDQCCPSNSDDPLICPGAAASQSIPPPGAILPYPQTFSPFTAAHSAILLSQAPISPMLFLPDVPASSGTHRTEPIWSAQSSSNSFIGILCPPGPVSSHSAEPIDLAAATISSGNLPSPTSATNPVKAASSLSRSAQQLVTATPVVASSSTVPATVPRYTSRVQQGPNPALQTELASSSRSSVTMVPGSIPALASLPRSSALASLPRSSALASFPRSSALVLSYPPPPRPDCARASSSRRNIPPAGFSSRSSAFNLGCPPPSRSARSGYSAESSSSRYTIPANRFSSASSKEQGQEDGEESDEEERFEIDAGQRALQIFTQKKQMISRHHWKLANQDMTSENSIRCMRMLVKHHNTITDQIDILRDNAKHRELAASLRNAHMEMLSASIMVLSYFEDVRMPNIVTLEKQRVQRDLRRLQLGKVSLHG